MADLYYCVFRIECFRMLTSNLQNNSYENIYKATEKININTTQKTHIKKNNINNNKKDEI